MVTILGWMGDIVVTTKMTDNMTNITTLNMTNIADDLSPIPCLTFASLLAAVDPVAVLAIFQEIGVNSSLYFLVFGESLLNDGVTVVLYNTMIALAKIGSGGEGIDGIQYFLAFLNFFTVFFGGLLIGILIGLATSLILRLTKHTHELEPMIILTMSYLAYMFAETVHWSGIISLIGCGIAQKRYAFLNISQKSYTTVKYSVKTLASFSDCIIFVYLGIVPFSEHVSWHLGFTGWTLLFATFYRFLGVFILTTILNKDRIPKISLQEQFIVGYGGLRGAVAFSLANVLSGNNPFKPIFLGSIIIVVFVTVFLQGGTMKYIVKKLHIKTQQNQAKTFKTILDDISNTVIDHAMAGVEGVAGGVHRHILFEHMLMFDSKYIKPLLIHKKAEDLMALKFKKISVSQPQTTNNSHSCNVNDVNKVPSTGVVNGADHKLSSREEDRNMLLSAFSNSPYKRYQLVPFHQEHIYQEITKVRQRSKSISVSNTYSDAPKNRRSGNVLPSIIIHEDEINEALHAPKMG